MNLINIILAQKFDLKELLGITAGLFVFASFIFKKEHLIRIINSIGCLFFVTYGSVMPTPLYSVIVINALLFIVQIVYLVLYYKNKKQKKNFDLAELELKLTNFEAKVSSDLKNELSLINKEVITLIKTKDEEISQLKASIKDSK